MKLGMSPCVHPLINEHSHVLASYSKNGLSKHTCADQHMTPQTTANLLLRCIWCQGKLLIEHLEMVTTSEITACCWESTPATNSVACHFIHWAIMNAQGGLKWKWQLLSTSVIPALVIMNFGYKGSFLTFLCSVIITTSITSVSHISDLQLPWIPPIFPNS